MRVVIKSAMILSVAIMAVLFEASHPGFYTKKFNISKEELIIKNELLGQPIQLAFDFLGKPNRVIEKENGLVIVEYYPYSFIPFSRFQLKVVQGKLEKVKKFVF